MSGFVFNENIKREFPMMEYNKFCMSESIAPVKIEYGTNFKNKKWFKIGLARYTFYVYEERAYAVVIDDNNIGFMTSDTIPTLKELYDRQTLKKYFNFDSRLLSDALRTFNYFFYIILEAIKEFNYEYIEFNPANKRLGEFYKKIIKNKFFISQLGEVGLYYQGIIDDGNYRFSNKKPSSFTKILNKLRYK